MVMRTQARARLGLEREDNLQNYCTVTPPKKPAPDMVNTHLSRIYDSKTLLQVKHWFYDLYNKMRYWCFMSDTYDRENALKIAVTSWLMLRSLSYGLSTEGL